MFESWLIFTLGGKHIWRRFSMPSFGGKRDLGNRDHGCRRQSRTAICTVLLAELFLSLEHGCQYFQFCVASGKQDRRWRQPRPKKSSVNLFSKWDFFIQHFSYQSTLNQFLGWDYFCDFCVADFVPAHKKLQHVSFFHSNRLESADGLMRFILCFVLAYA